MKKQNLVSLALCALSVVSMTGCGGKNYTKNNTEFFIGVSGPLTGGASSYGIAVQKSAELAVKEINANGGFNGIKFKLEAMDDKLDADTASTNFSSLYEKGMQVSLGGVTSGACLAFNGDAQKKGVFSLTPSATNNNVPLVGDCCYQMCFTDPEQGAKAAEYVKANYSSKKIGIFYDFSDDYSRGVFEGFKSSDYGTNTIKEALFTSDSKTDFTSQITQLKDCDFIFLPIYYSEAALFIQTAKDTVKKDVVYFGCDGLDGIEGVAQFNAADYTTAPYNQKISYLTHFSSSDAKATNYVAAYKQAYPDAPLNQFGAAAYDCVYAIYNAMVASGKDIKANIAADELGKILKDVFTSSTFSYNGVTGTGIKWDANGKVVKPATIVPVNYTVE